MVPLSLQQSLIRPQTQNHSLELKVDLKEFEYIQVNPFFNPITQHCWSKGAHTVMSTGYWWGEIKNERKEDNVEEIQLV